MAYLQAKNIPVLPLLFKSPDLNPIKHLLDGLNRRVWQRQPQPQLTQALQEEWATNS